jgi:SPP1 gp7 family putative phage head morphogenesis protein
MLEIKFPLPFQEALAKALSRNIVPPAEYYSPDYTAGMRSRAFSIAKLAQLDVIKQVLDFMNTKMLEEGGTYQQFKKAAAEMGWNLPFWRLELIMRNHMQNAYQAGHWQRYIRNKRVRPYLMYDAVNDNRTRPAHRALDGMIKEVDDPIWSTYAPPLGHNCRCSLRALTEEQAKARGGLTIGIPSGGGPDPGWGSHPLYERNTQLEQLTQQKLAQLPPKMSKVKKAKPPVKQVVPFDPFVVGGTASAVFVKYIKNLHSMLPSSITGLVAKMNGKVVITNTLVDAAPDLANEQPRGWRKGSTWKNVEGCYRPDQKEAIVAERHMSNTLNAWVKNRRIAQTFYHEYGHMLDDAMVRVSNEPTFLAAYKADVAAMGSAASTLGVDYFLQPGMAGPQEAFAELFASLFDNDSGYDYRVAKHFPQARAALSALLPG